MVWLSRERAPLTTGGQRRETPDGLWVRCVECSEIVFRKDFEANLNVCPKCAHHYQLPIWDRIRQFLDAGTISEVDRNLSSPDPLNFVDTKPYRQRLQDSQRKLSKADAFVSVEGLLKGRPIQFGGFDFQFMGGSMGSVVGEKVSRLFLRSIEKHQPAVVFSSSGGARMHEGILSLMQMAKTCAALGRLRSTGVPFISILGHPTTGGVAASFAMVGDVNIGEPGALIGFAGPRVIQQTIRQKLPEGFQSAEFLLQHGMLDMICHRERLRETIAQLLDLLLPRPGESS